MHASTGSTTKAISTRWSSTGASMFSWRSTISSGGSCPNVSTILGEREKLWFRMFHRKYFSLKQLAQTVFSVQFFHLIYILHSTHYIQYNSINKYLYFLKHSNKFQWNKIKLFKVCHCTLFSFEPTRAYTRIFPVFLTNTHFSGIYLFILLIKLFLNEKVIDQSIRFCILLFIQS